MQAHQAVVPKWIIVNRAALLNKWHSTKWVDQWTSGDCDSLQFPSSLATPSLWTLSLGETNQANQQEADIRERVRAVRLNSVVHAQRSWEELFDDYIQSRIVLTSIRTPNVTKVAFEEDRPELSPHALG